MADLRVRVLGGLQVEGVAPGQLGSRKARTLLKVLALARGKAVSIDRLAECLWPENLPSRPAEQVRVLVSRLRAVLGADALPRSDAGYALVVAWLDLEALADLVEEARSRLQSGRPAPARTAAAAAVAVARGPLLPEDDDADWAAADRAWADRLVADARRIGAEAALAAGDPTAAGDQAQRALDHDPFDEAALRALMTALSLSGRPASALAAYVTTRARLADELGISPSAETEALHDAIVMEEPIVASAGTQGAGPTGELPGPGPSLPGRAHALDVLDEAFARAAQRKGGLVEVRGEAGIGKSRLLSTWATRLAAAGAILLSSRCDEVTRALPLQAVIDALDDQLRATGPEGTAAILGSEEALVGPLLGRPGASPETAAPSDLREQGGNQALVFGALVAVLARFPAPTVVMVDDVHLADASTLAWIHYASRRASHLPLLLVAAQRSEEALRLPADTVVNLDPLDEEAAAEIVGPTRAAELVARSGGNPLFLTELAAADPDGELPVNIREAVAARCERAGSETAVTLRTAAVIGSSIDLDLLAAVRQRSTSALLDDLEEGAARGLLVEQGAGFAFRHALLRDALEADMSAARRALIHRDTARAAAGRPSSDPLMVAHHARLGGDDLVAAAALREAAAVASGRSDQAEALRLLDRSLELAESLEARLLRARVLIMLADFAAAGVDAEVALSLGAGPAAFELAAWAAHYRRDFGTAVRLADEGAEVARRAGDVDHLAGCLTIAGWVCQCTGDLAGAEARLSEAAGLAVRSWKPVSDVWLGGLRECQGRCRDAIDLIRPGALAEAVAVHGYPTAHAHLFAALALAGLGRTDEALAAVDGIERDEARTGTTRWAGRADNTRGWILRGLGQLDEADECNQRGLERSTAISMPEPMSHAHLDLAAGALLVDDIDRAAAEVAAARRLGDTHAMAWRHGLRTRLYEAEIALATGDIETASAGADRLVVDAERIGTSRYVALARLVGARAAVLAGDAIDIEAVDRTLASLDSFALLEGWRLTAQMAAATGVDRWWSLAETRVAALAAEAGARADGFQRAAGTTLERMRTTGRRG